MCNGTGTSVEFVPEGLDRLGLCTPSYEWWSKWFGQDALPYLESAHDHAHAHVIIPHAYLFVVLFLGYFIYFFPFRSSLCSCCLFKSTSCHLYLRTLHLPSSLDDPDQVLRVHVLSPGSTSVDRVANCKVNWQSNPNEGLCQSRHAVTQSTTARLPVSAPARYIDEMPLQVRVRPDKLIHTTNEPTKLGYRFKKNLNRAGTTLMQKTGQIERTVDREFADEEAKYKAFEKETNALQKESKAYLDAMRAMTAAQTRLAETIDTFYAAADKASEGAMAGHAYKRSVDELDAGVTRELDAPYRTTVFEPVGKMCSYFPIINDGIAKRNKKVCLSGHVVYGT
ncbi:Hob3p [Rhizoctonia solani AG-1 IA]|uniref:Hob3p n=1 Tax=Thanatephorus cucumeris (strain AG1-IA) TaxID=983506 RepID=L8X0U6_THACA|nr:Hob3p [Rhizoctonia solani AG-1 IA]